MSILPPVPIAPLFIPAHKAHLIEKAEKTSADALFLDLEDAVSADEKPQAREAVIKARTSKNLWVRINDVRSDYFEDDIACLRACDFENHSLKGILLPKLETPSDIETLHDRLGQKQPVIGFIETARGLVNIHECFRHDALLTVIFGNLDFALDIGAKPIREALLFARSSIIIATKHAGKAPPLDGVTADFKDETQLLSDLDYAANLGFGGRLSIHPSQIAPTIKAFMPTDADIAKARAILDAAGDRLVAQLDGQMIDKPVIDQAKIILQKASIK